MHDRHVMMVTSFAGLFCALLIIADLATSPHETLRRNNRDVPAELNAALGISFSGHLPQPPSETAVHTEEPISPVDAETTRVDAILERMDRMNLLAQDVAASPPLTSESGPKQ